MKLFHRILIDFKHGENIDLYSTVTVSVILVVLNILNIVPPSLIVPLNLAVLALLSIAILGNRYRIETMLERMTSKNDLLLTHFPDNLLFHDIDKAKHLMCLGIDLDRMLRRNYARLEKNLKRGSSIKVMLVNPESAACEMAATLHFEPTTVADKRDAIMRSLRILQELKQKTNGKLEIRLADHLPSFGAVVADIETPDGVIYFWQYAFKADDAGRFKLILRHIDGYWYEAFKVEVVSIWNNARVWAPK